MRAIYSYLLREGYPKLLADIQRDIAGIREHYGALGADAFYQKLLREGPAADGKGLIYISKLRIVRGLSPGTRIPSCAGRTLS